MSNNEKRGSKEVGHLDGLIDDWWIAFKVQWNLWKTEVFLVFTWFFSLETALIMKSATLTPPSRKFRITYVLSIFFFALYNTSCDNPTLCRSFCRSFRQRHISAHYFGTVPHSQPSFLVDGVSWFRCSSWRWSEYEVGRTWFTRLTCEWIFFVGGTLWWPVPVCYVLAGRGKKRQMQVIDYANAFRLPYLNFLILFFSLLCISTHPSGQLYWF